MTWLWVVAALTVGFTAGWIIRHPPEVAPPLPEPPAADRPWFPLELLVELIDPESWIRANADVDRVHGLTVSMRVHGIREPLIVIVDPRGRAVLKDGHHRLAAALRIGLRGLPVQLRDSDGIRGHSHPVRPVLEALLQVQLPVPQQPVPHDEPDRSEAA